MNFTRKIDRAMQWAGEKMGAEAKATHSEEFKELEAEMDIRHEGLCFFQPIDCLKQDHLLTLRPQAWSTSSNP
jgi:hypothetical protein